ncbi:uncharacterized protein LOC115712332 [Cannabis sativa]|uniref:uncharacterized protein LOC115712332 n=1 Tax=Cannabis sativa TaxID=3483 RepID=UPI0029CA5694|nr:uncharacterized protein LOC115712332 [Cannabis sativa]
MDNVSGWKRLWKLGVPPKVLHFLWCVVSSCLPTKVQLQTKHVNVDLQCQFCLTFYETISHVLMECQFAKAFEVSVDTAMVSWSIWNARNDVFWKQKNCSWCSTLGPSHSAAVVCCSSSKNRPAAGFQFTFGVERWKKPLSSSIKVNVDGAIFSAEQKFGFGYVARDAHGKLIEGILGSWTGAVGPEIAEVIGVKEALSWIKRKGWTGVEIETDALVVVQAVLGSVSMPSQFGFLVQDCRSLISSLNCVSLHFVKRSVNRVAHCVARASCFHSDRIFSERNAPPELMSMVDAECF